jgi:hypothetical protein
MTSSDTSKVWKRFASCFLIWLGLAFELSKSVGDFFHWLIVIALIVALYLIAHQLLRDQNRIS